MARLREPWAGRQCGGPGPSIAQRWPEQAPSQGERADQRRFPGRQGGTLAQSSLKPPQRGWLGPPAARPRVQQPGRGWVSLALLLARVLRQTLTDPSATAPVIPARLCPQSPSPAMKSGPAPLRQHQKPLSQAPLGPAGPGRQSETPRDAHLPQVAAVPVRSWRAPWPVPGAETALTQQSAQQPQRWLGREMSASLALPGPGLLRTKSAAWAEGSRLPTQPRGRRLFRPCCEFRRCPQIQRRTHFATGTWLGGPGGPKLCHHQHLVLVMIPDLPAKRRRQCGSRATPRTMCPPAPALAPLPEPAGRTAHLWP